ncbi:MAG: hypothetical protein ABI888_01925 [Chloroflexota bacterium]
MSIALAIAFFATGVRTPLLALLALRRLRNVAVVALPYATGLLVVALLGPAVGEAERAGLLAVAVSPALLSAPALATAIGGRMDRAGAFLVGSIAASFILVLTRASTAGGAMQSAMLALVIGAGVTSVVPMLPELPRIIVRRLGDLAFVALLAIAVAGGPALGPVAALAAVMLVIVTAAAAALTARIAGVDVSSAIAGAGTRDPAVATALAIALAGSPAAGVPLYSAALLLVLGALFVALNRRKAR